MRRWAMPVCEQPMIECKKCGTSVSVEMLRRRDTRACVLCSEPLAALIDLDRCDWSEGDFAPKEGQAQ